MPAERVSMRQIPEGLPTGGLQASWRNGHCQEPRGLRRGGCLNCEPALAHRSRDQKLESLLFPPPRVIAADQPPDARLGPVHRELRRHLCKGYRAGAPDVRLFLVLRSVPGQGAPVPFRARPRASAPITPRTISGELLGISRRIARADTALSAESRRGRASF
jgi:hypothetical protein